jgi:hypothetical protein
MLDARYWILAKKQINIFILGGCPRIDSLPRKELKIFSDILMSKT